MIAGGRNTSIQVHTKSLLDLDKKFDFLKEELARHEWANQVAWRENDDGDVDVVDVIARLSCFDIETYPDRHTHPVDAYRRKSSMLNRFKTHPERYERLVPIVRDVLFLHDWIAYDAEQRWQAVGGSSGTGGKYGRLEMVEHSKPGRPAFTFRFLDGETSDHRLRPPVVLPILATFRLLLEPDPTAEAVGGYQPVRWRNGFAEALAIWEKVGGRLLQDFYEHFASTGRDLHACGRSPALWRSLCNEMVVSLADHRQQGLFGGSEIEVDAGKPLTLKDIEKSDMTSLDKYLARQQLAAYKKLMETGEPQTIATAEISPRAKVVTYVKHE